MAAPAKRGMLGMSAKEMHEYATSPKKGMPASAKKKCSIGEMMKGSK